MVDSGCLVYAKEDNQNQHFFSGNNKNEYDTPSLFLSPEEVLTTFVILNLKWSENSSVFFPVPFHYKAMTQNKASSNV